MSYSSGLPYYIIVFSIQTASNIMVLQPPVDTRHLKHTSEGPSDHPLNSITFGLSTLNSGLYVAHHPMDGQDRKTNGDRGRVGDTLSFLC